MPIFFTFIINIIWLESAQLQGKLFDKRILETFSFKTLFRSNFCFIIFFLTQSWICYKNWIKGRFKFSFLKLRIIVHMFDLLYNKSLLIQTFPLKNSKFLFFSLWKKWFEILLVIFFYKNYQKDFPSKFISSAIEILKNSWRGKEKKQLKQIILLLFWFIEEKIISN